MPFADREPTPTSASARAVAFARAWRNLRLWLIQCDAGLSRSADGADAVRRVVDGTAHEESLVRGEHVIEQHKCSAQWPHPVTRPSAQAWCDAQDLPGG